MSLTMMRDVLEPASLPRASAGAGRPRGARNSVSSRYSSPSRSRAIRMRSAEHACRAARTVAIDLALSETFSNVQDFRVELDRAVQIRNGHADANRRLTERLAAQRCGE